MLGSWCSEFLFAQWAQASCTVHDLQSLSDAQCQQSHQSRGVAGGRTPLLVFLSMWTHISVVSCFCPSYVRWPSKQWAVTGCAVGDRLGSIFTAHVLESEVCGLRLQTVWWKWGWRGGSSACVQRHSSRVIPAHALHSHICPAGWGSSGRNHGLRTGRQVFIPALLFLAGWPYTHPPSPDVLICEKSEVRWYM